MAQLKAFKAYRLQQEWAAAVAALPYDVMSTEEAKEMVQGHPYSFLNIDKPDIHIKASGEAPYLYAADKLQELLDKGIYIQDEESFYIYELESENAHQYGLVGLVSTEDYQKGIIKKHENTRVDKENDRIQHILHCKAHTGPIFLAEDSIEDFSNQLTSYAASQRPIVDVTFNDGITHRIYQISHQENIQELIEIFSKVPALYIADGHHRAAAACKAAQELPENEEASHFLAVIFPKEQLHILAYHRVLKDESGLSRQQLFDKLTQLFEIEKITSSVYLPEKGHFFGMRYQKEWYALRCKKHLYEGKGAVESLDVSILQQHVLLPIFGIADPKNDERIDFVPGIRPADELNKRTEEEMDIAFSLYPTSMEELLSVADSGRLMPPKSTWFEPKLRSGFFIHRF